MLILVVLIKCEQWCSGHYWTQCIGKCNLARHVIWNEALKLLIPRTSDHELPLLTHYITVLCGKSSLHKIPFLCKLPVSMNLLAFVII